MQDSTIWFLLAICGLGIILLAMAIFLFLSVLRFSGRGVLGIFSFLANSRLEDTVEPEKIEARPDLRHVVQTSAQGFDVALMQQQARVQAAAQAAATAAVPAVPVPDTFSSQAATPPQPYTPQSFVPAAPLVKPSLIPPGFSAAPTSAGQGVPPAPPGFAPVGSVLYPTAAPGAPAPNPVPPPLPPMKTPSLSPFENYSRPLEYDHDDPHLLGGMVEDDEDDFGG